MNGSNLDQVPYSALGVDSGLRQGDLSLLAFFQLSDLEFGIGDGYFWTCLLHAITADTKPLENTTRVVES